MRRSGGMNHRAHAVLFGIILAIAVTLPATALTLATRSMHKGDTFTVTCPTTLSVKWSNALRTKAVVKCSLVRTALPTPPPAVAPPVEVTTSSNKATTPFRLWNARATLAITLTSDTCASASAITAVYLKRAADSSYVTGIQVKGCKTVTSEVYGIAPGDHYLQIDLGDATVAVTFTPHN